MQFNLVAHPATPAADPEFKVWVIVDYAASFGAMATANLWLGVGASAQRFVIPAGGEGTRADDLWQTTCFEAFLREQDAEAYREWNFAPSGDWAAYDFATYREGMSEADIEAPPYVRFEDNFTWWALGATIAVPADQSLQLGLSAVIEEKDGTKSYWALCHPAEKPDFHHPDCFVAKLA